MEDNQKQKGVATVPPLVMVGCLFIGIAIGMLKGNIAAGTLIGLGVGFIAMAVLRYAMQKKDGGQS